VLSATRFGETNWACAQEETWDASATSPRAVLERAILTVSRRGRESQARYLFFEVWRARQARTAASACSRSSAVLNSLRCSGGWPTTGVLSLRSSTPCRRMRLRLATRDQFTRPLGITHTPTRSARSQQSRRGKIHEKARRSCRAPNRRAWGCRTEA